MSYFPPYGPNKNKIEVVLDLSNYATKSDLKNATGVTISQCTKKDYLASLKSQVDELDIDKLKTTPVDLSKLSYVVKNAVLKKANMMNWLKKLMLFRLLILAT